MKASHLENIGLLRKIRGNFRDSIATQRRELMMAFLFLIIFPAILLFFFLADPQEGRLVFLVLALASIFGGILFWMGRGPVEYEFTGEEIIEKRRGKIKKRLQIDAVVETKTIILTRSRREFWVLKTRDSAMVIQLIPLLSEAVQIELMKKQATHSEAEQQFFENVKTETISRLKRKNLIISVILVLFALVSAFFILWLNEKH